MQGRKAPSGIDHLNSKLFPYNRAFRRSLHPSAVVLHGTRYSDPSSSTPNTPDPAPNAPESPPRAEPPKDPHHLPAFARERPRDQMDTNAKISKNPEKILAKIAEKSPFDSAALKAIEIMGARPARACVYVWLFGCADDDDTPEQSSEQSCLSLSLQLRLSSVFAGHARLRGEGVK